MIARLAELSGQRNQVASELWLISQTLRSRTGTLNSINSVARRIPGSCVNSP